VGAQDAAVLLFANIFPGGGSPIADLFSIALAILMFALLYWLISLIDRI
jgi:hypothetical protein